MSISPRPMARELEDKLKAGDRQKTCAGGTRPRPAAITEAELAGHDQDQLQFDRVESVNFESRILRLLRYRIQSIENGRLPPA